MLAIFMTGRRDDFGADARASTPPRGQHVHYLLFYFLFR